MVQHLRANLWLLSLAVLICCVLYPLVLLGIGQAVFPEKANGSLILDKNGNPVGSRFIAQPFNGDEYFHPRPSAASYNGAASGASNWSASNPALRHRVEGVLGTVLKYKDGRPVGPDIAEWVKAERTKDPGVIAKWTADDSSIAEHWAGGDPAVGTFLTTWQNEHGDAVKKWKEANPGTDIAPKDVAALFLESFSKGETKTWPETNGGDLKAAFFSVWWRAHPNLEVQPVPADMVMASGSGLDPHITLDSALYQLDRVAGARAAKTKQDSKEIREKVEHLLQEKAEAPLSGMVGVKLVNVLEVNLAMDDMR